ncbi:MAG: sigma-54 dependent transcriptional regulator [Bacteroidota bacterium]
MLKNERIKILLLDDDRQVREALNNFFQESEFESFEANNVADAKHLLENHTIDLFVLALGLPGVNDLDLLKEVKDSYPSMEVVVISAHGDMDTVIKVMRLGASDFLRKPFRLIDIRIAIERTQKYLHLQRKLKHTEEKNSLISMNLEQKINRHFIGVSDKIKKVFDQAMMAAQYPDVNVLITGESGTGKENVARIIHYSSSRKDHVLCTVNSSAITETLLESEFFGHKKGSFTDAISDKMGYFEATNGSTLFLDEIADMSMSLQAKILRAIEEKVFTRVGDNTQIQSEFRIISTTNHDISIRVKEQKFRLDLLHRLNTLHIHIPPLRERPEDIRPLLIHFVNLYAQRYKLLKLKIEDQIFYELMDYNFPGNVRELRNLCERALMLCNGNKLTVKDFLIKSTQSLSEKESIEADNLEFNEVKLIRRVLLRSRFNQQLAADALGIHRDALSRKIKKYQIPVDKTRV